VYPPGATAPAQPNESNVLALTNCDQPGHEHACKYYVFDTPHAVDFIYTFGATSCSVACMWSSDGHIALSHINAKPPIPLATILKRAGAKGPYFEIASCWCEAHELSKFARRMPHTESVSAALLARGPLKYQDEPDNQPNLSHLYAGLALGSTVLFQGGLGVDVTGAIGGSNGPMHGVLGHRELIALFARQSASDLKELSDHLVLMGGRLINGQFGFKELWLDIITGLEQTGVNLTPQKGETPTARLTLPSGKLAAYRELIKVSPQVGGVLSKPARAAFLLFEAATDWGSVPDFVQAPVRDAFRRFQLGFRFPLNGTTLNQLRTAGKTI
jgi:hypothetical protein